MMRVINPIWAHKCEQHEVTEMRLIKKRKEERKVQNLIIEALMKKR
jgi:hypothetical protein